MRRGVDLWPVASGLCVDFGSSPKPVFIQKPYISMVTAKKFRQQFMGSRILGILNACPATISVHWEAIEWEKRISQCYIAFVDKAIRSLAANGWPDAPVAVGRDTLRIWSVAHICRFLGAVLTQDFQPSLATHLPLPPMQPAHERLQGHGWCLQKPMNASSWWGRCLA